MHHIWEPGAQGLPKSGADHRFLPKRTPGRVNYSRLNMEARAQNHATPARAVPRALAPASARLKSRRGRRVPCRYSRPKARNRKPSQKAGSGKRGKARRPLRARTKKAARWATLSELENTCAGGSGRNMPQATAMQE